MCKSVMPCLVLWDTLQLYIPIANNQPLVFCSINFG